MVDYRTGELARMAKIHPNTVRLYENKGYLSPVPRAANGYRVFNDRHVYQLKVCRCIFSYPWVGKEIRQASLEVIRAMAQWNLDLALELLQEYLGLINKQKNIAQLTAEILQRWANKERPSAAGIKYSRKQAAAVIGVTPEALRNWERNDLISVPRVGANRDRVYGDYEIERLRIIYMLRLARYSIAAIHRSLQKYDSGDLTVVVPALTSPKKVQELTWVWVGDRWLDILSDVACGAKEAMQLVEEVKHQKL